MLHTLLLNTSSVLEPLYLISNSNGFKIVMVNICSLAYVLTFFPAVEIGITLIQSVSIVPAM